MIAVWMLYATAVATLVSGAAALVERAARAQGRAGRFVWIGALAAAALLPAAPLLRAPGSAPVAERLASEPVAVAAARSAAALTPIVDAPPALPRAPSVPVASTTSHGPRPGRWTSWTLASLDAPLLALWAAATALLVLGLVVIAAKLAGRRCEWQPDRVDGADVLIARELGPAVVGVVRPRIVLPAWALDLDDEARELIVAHETEHVRAGDARTISLGILAVVLCPWNAGLWWAYRRLRLAVELDCDARVLARRPDVSSYGNLLLDVGRRAARGPLVAASLAEGRHELERRIVTMTERRDRPRAAQVAACVGGAAMLLAAACATPRPARVAATPAGGRSLGIGDSILYRSVVAANEDLQRRGLLSDSALATGGGCTSDASPTGRRQLVILVPTSTAGDSVLLQTYDRASAPTIPTQFSSGVVILHDGSAGGRGDYQCAFGSGASRVRVSSMFAHGPASRLIVLGDRPAEVVVRMADGRTILGPMLLGGANDSTLLSWSADGRGGAVRRWPGSASFGEEIEPGGRVQAMSRAVTAVIGRRPTTIVVTPGRVDVGFDADTADRSDVIRRSTAQRAAHAAWTTYAQVAAIDTVAVWFAREEHGTVMRRETYLFYPQDLAGPLPPQRVDWSDSSSVLDARVKAWARRAYPDAFRPGAPLTMIAVVMSGDSVLAHMTRRMSTDVDSNSGTVDEMLALFPALARRRYVVGGVMALVHQPPPPPHSRPRAESMIVWADVRADGNR